MRRVILSCLVGVLLSLPSGVQAAQGDAPTLLTTVWFEQLLHFTTPAGDLIVVPPGIYQIEPESSQSIQISSNKHEPWVVNALSTIHEESIEQSVAIGLRDETSPTLTHLVLATADGRLYFATGSTDGVTPRAVPTHIIVAMFKTAMTGSPVKPPMQMEPRTNRPGKPYRTFTLFAGMCTLLCERDMDCRAYTWTRDPAKPVKGSCQLMKDIPPKQDDDCCLSGAKPVVRKK